MNNQEAFNKLCDTLMGMKDKPPEHTRLSNQVMCKYRSAEGYRCPIGQLILDDEYDPKWEGMSVIAIGKDVPSFAGLNLDMLYAVQIMHDQIHLSLDLNKIKQAWLYGLREVAKVYDLTLPALLVKHELW